MLGCNNVAADGTCEGYYWFTFLYAPIYPIRKIRFERRLTERDFFEFFELQNLKTDRMEVLNTYLKGWLLYPILIFWPIPLVVTEVYHGVLHGPEALYNWFIAFALIWIVVIVWRLADQYERQGLPPDYREQMRRLQENNSKKKASNDIQ